MTPDEFADKIVPVITPENAKEVLTEKGNANGRRPINRRGSNPKHVRRQSTNISGNISGNKPNTLKRVVSSLSREKPNTLKRVVTKITPRKRKEESDHVNGKTRTSLQQTRKVGRNPSCAANDKPAGVRFLRFFRFLCGGDSREVIDLSISDILRGRRSMRRRGFNESEIELVALIQAAKSAVRVTWEGFAMILKAINPFGCLLREISRVLGKE